MNTKPNSLAAFTGKGATALEKKTVQIRGPKTRGQGATVALTVRLPRDEWVRLTNLAMTEGVPLQELAIRGFDKLFADQGLPPIRRDVVTSGS